MKILLISPCLGSRLRVNIKQLFVISLALGLASCAPSSNKVDVNPVGSYSGILSIDVVDQEAQVIFNVQANNNGTYVGRFTNTNDEQQWHCLVSGSKMTCSGQDATGSFNMSGKISDSAYTGKYKVTPKQGLVVTGKFNLIKN